MTEEGALREAIRVAPNDDAPKLVLADWLTENGKTDEAEQIVAEVREKTAYQTLTAALRKVLGEKGGLHLKPYGDDGFAIEWTQMYDSPDLNFDLLFTISALFSTTLIDVGIVSEGGCESCDYGSKYGHQIIVRKPKKWLAELTLLKSTTLGEC